MLAFIHKIPILTTLLSVGFFTILYKHWDSKGRPPYLFWWTLGVLTYGLGTLTESIVGLFGWCAPIFKAWYILGALLGGFPLAQGSVYLMFSKRTGDIMGGIVVAIILIASVLVLLSPINYDLVEPARLTGGVLSWSKVRLITPFVNIYAFIFLVGGAFYSAYRYSKERIYKNRFLGNLFIAFGGLLPGIGGSFTKFGYTEVLYVTELLGIILIYLGYTTIRQDKTLSVYAVQN
ncbi:MAG TPA: hypothetical protein DIS90_09830 [Cytophagales bacterium]|nr:hypothetical protein [Cytophagales bacterium]HCR53639.1 hypothetical protein [Cytophagales bacterium]